jgi:hypothetical protein
MPGAKLSWYPGSIARRKCNVEICAIRKGPEMSPSEQREPAVEEIIAGVASY